MYRHCDPKFEGHSYTHTYARKGHKELVIRMLLERSGAGHRLPANNTMLPITHNVEPCLGNRELNMLAESQRDSRALRDQTRLMLPSGSIRYNLWASLIKTILAAHLAIEDQLNRWGRSNIFRKPCARQQFQFEMMQ